MKCFKNFAVGLLAASFMLFPGCGNSSDIPFHGTGDKWTAGFGYSDIIKNPEEILDGDHNLYVAGFSGVNKATGILDIPKVRAIWLDDNSGRGGVILCAVDCVGLSGEDIDSMRSMLSDFTKDSGCRAIHIMSTHTHAAPDTLGLWGPVAICGKDADYMKALSESVYDAVNAAYNDRRDGKLYYGCAEIPGIQRDSRDPQVYSDKLDRFRFEDETGHSICIFRFDSHPEALGGNNTLISADFPAYMMQYIKEETGDDSIFFTGAIGGLISTHRQVNSDGSEMDNISSTYRTGRIFADAALSIDNELEVTPALNIATAKFDVTLENTTFALMQSLGVINYKANSGGGELGLSIETSVTFCSIGGICCVFVPGEIFPELAYGGYMTESELNPHTLSDIAGVERVLVFGLCDDELGYIVPESDFLLDDKAPYLNAGYEASGRRHYEETNCVGPKTAAALAEAFEELVREVLK